MMIVHRRVDFLGCPLDLYTSNALISELDAEITRKAGPRVIHFVNGNKIAKASEDLTMRDILWRGDYVLADGQPLLPMARMLGIRIPERIDGIGLMHSLLGLASDKQYGVYLLGGRQEILDKCVEVIGERYPGVRLVGSRNGYFATGDLAGMAAKINHARPDILFIGIGSPIKEQLADEWRAELNATVIQGVGGSFDVLAGLVSRAPEWMQRLGLEWLYRVIQEPRRMFWRYAKTNTQCLWIFARALAGV
ncbi:MAG TPA: WecB/TagA/CpsF family glycosyltransferase [Vicinamibacterales bacterium]|jgi:N-acetylglucosaminyldiphosphoundecaprenol N-acetyl-beta-D-mannosaminyltransferase|nr:WecB/TagA/CpsF family glycosyltransferase [Vicinamibacterales bacterium]